MKLIGAGLAVLLTVLFDNTADAAELRLLVTNGIKPVVTDLGPSFESSSGHKLIVSYQGSNAKVPYDIDKDFIPVTKAGGTPNSWVVHASHPAKTMKDLVELIRREPGKHSVGSPGTGTTPSLSIDMMRLALKLDFITVPFQGGGPMTTSLLGGHTPIVCSALGNYVNLIKDGKLRGLAVTASKRSAALPDIPTLHEFGIKDQDAETMTGVFVPAGTPKPVVDLLQKEIAAVVNSPDIKARLLEAGVEAEGNSQADFAAYVRAEVAKWRKVIEDARIARI
jgi:tripartite-type tricarboxylate transporter receptor subunit TctC